MGCGWLPWTTSFAAGASGGVSGEYAPPPQWRFSSYDPGFVSLEAGAPPISGKCVWAGPCAAPSAPELDRENSLDRLQPSWKGDRFGDPESLCPTARLGAPQNLVWPSGWLVTLLPYET